MRLQISVQVHFRKLAAGLEIGVSLIAEICMDDREKFQMFECISLHSSFRYASKADAQF